jgi:8-oxo-dGTP pyrophosphatase MutT (NUDIX family)
MPSYVRKSSRLLHENAWVRVELHDILHPNGTPGEHLLVRVPSASAAVVIDGEDVLLTAQPRFAADKVVLEIPKGGAEGGEGPLSCAKRETREELGIEAERWTALGFVYEIPSIAEGKVNLFLAREVRFVPASPERVESIELARIPLDMALKMAFEGGIDDAVTVAALARAAHALDL